MDSWIKTAGMNDSKALLVAVSTLVLMDSWIKTSSKTIDFVRVSCFNPCFNGFMDKDTPSISPTANFFPVSTLVLMDSWIKTGSHA